MPIPRTRVNKGKKRGRGCSRPQPLRESNGATRNWCFRSIYAEGYDAIVPAPQVTFVKNSFKAQTLTLPEFVVIETTTIGARVDTLYFVGLVGSGGKEWVPAQSCFKLVFDVRDTKKRWEKRFTQFKSYTKCLKVHDPLTCLWIVADKRGHH
jgi:hypothetical protein